MHKLLKLELLSKSNMGTQDSHTLFSVYNHLQAVQIQAAVTLCKYSPQT